MRGCIFQDPETNPILLLQFDNTKAKEFSSEQDYLQLVEFFNGNNIKFIIKEHLDDERHSYYRSSFVNMETADSINIDSVLWGVGTLVDF